MIKINKIGIYEYDVAKYLLSVTPAFIDCYNLDMIDHISNFSKVELESTICNLVL